MCSPFYLLILKQNLASWTGDVVQTILQSRSNKNSMVLAQKKDMKTNGTE
jgi:hypothetical protein